ncbi:hypothetical protein [Bacillus benzoevorans]|uniref:Uncharacterized protein n=1 Tax=Bacillus benzoevorans TaxID=1456 RepID=A0A7X0HQY6_9BACI|nr:hypothetical protein [Bacillus benzoevorans]MBB6443946.1 hypothetical protein [Bacillus benzoevorans]
MIKVKTVKIDGKSIYLFNSALYIFESSIGYTLELDMIVTEVILKKYRNEENLILEIELEDGRMISSIMNVKVLPGGLPQLNLFCDLDEGDLQLYHDLDRVNESDLTFPNIEDGLTMEEIRKVEMPNEKMKLKLSLPIDQVEWLEKQKPGDINEMFKEMIYDYWKKYRK